MPLDSPRASSKAYAPAPIDWHDEEEHRRKLAEKSNDILQGKLNVLGTVTLTVSSTSTTITDSRIGDGTAVIFVPVTENAALESPWPRVTAWADGSATVTHASDSTIDREYIYVVLGALGTGLLTYPAGYPAVHSSDHSTDHS